MALGAAWGDALGSALWAALRATLVAALGAGLGTALRAALETALRASSGVSELQETIITQFFFRYMNSYVLPFHDVYDLHNVIYNESLPFEAFNSLQSSVTDVN